MKQKQNNKRMYLFLYATLLFFTPLLFVGNTNELYEFPKTFFLYLIGSSILVLFIIDVLLSRRKANKPDIYVVMFLVSLCITTVLSRYIYTSTWGYYTRFNGGLVSMLILLGLHYVAKNVFKPEDLYMLFKFIVISACLTSFYGVVQYFSGITRAYSTLGQPNWLAQYLSIVLLLVLYRYFKSKYRWNIWAVSSVILYLGMWFSYSLSGFIGFTAGFLVLVFMFFSKKGSHGLFKLALFSLFAVFVGVSFPGIFKAKVLDTFSDINKFRSVLISTVYAQEDNRISDPGFIRAGLWSGTLEAAFGDVKIFLIGSGLGTFPYVFQDYRPLSLNYSSEWDYVFNKPHNYYLELLVELGITGLFIYLVFILKLLKTSPKALLPPLVAYILSNFFGWPTVVPSILFWVILSTGIHEKYEEDN